MARDNDNFYLNYSLQFGSKTKYLLQKKTENMHNSYSGGKRIFKEMKRGKSDLKRNHFPKKILELPKILILIFQNPISFFQKIDLFDCANVKRNKVMNFGNFSHQTKEIPG